MSDPVKSPGHYSFPGGVEVIDITQHLVFLRGAAVKYICRAGRKGDELEDLRKARECVDREIARVEALRPPERSA